MPFYQLHIFSKKRDATAALKGYEYQHLKTLKTWLDNRLSRTDEWIYCDFEEDIFQRNILDGTIQFRQIKLYSTDFSFSSLAVQETLAAFFMLYVKGDYMFDAITFSFETNAAIVGRTIRGNDADLLEAWAGGWVNLPPETTSRIKDRVRSILAEYIEREYAARARDAEIKPELQKARNLFYELSDDALDRFARSINWQFDGQDTDGSVEILRSEVHNLIEKLPLPVVGTTAVVFSLLYREVVSRSLEVDPEKRKLSNDVMDLTMLRAGNTKNEWYADVYAKWSTAQEIRHFRAGEFYEIVDAARYCRMNMYEAKHGDIWKRLLNLYVNHPDTKIKHRRKAIYEVIFLTLNPKARSAEDVQEAGGQDENIRYYFDEWNSNSELDVIHEDIILLKIASSLVLMRKVKIEQTEIDGWNEMINGYLKNRLEGECTIDDLCKLLELMGDYQFNFGVLTPKEGIAGAIGYYRQILPWLGKAELYSINFLFEQLQEMISVLIRLQGKQDHIDMIEAFLGEVQDAAAATGQRHFAAKNLVARGVDYLKAPGLNNTLQALNCFHKAKSLWYLERTKEGYILSLINISQVYYVIGMNIAGKYYALCAIWATWHSMDESLYNRIAQSMGLMFYGDFKQGSWIAALHDYEIFMQAREKHNPVGWLGDYDEMFTKTLPDMAFLVFASKRFLPEMTVYFDYHVSKWGDLWEVFIKPAIETMNNLVEQGRTLTDIAREHISDEPLNDVGPTRIISFNALDIDWTIEFPNSYIMNAIGEEFISILQVFLSEIARTGRDLLTKGRTIIIHVREGRDYERIKKHERMDDWLAVIPAFSSKEQPKISYHYAFISLMLKEVFLEIAATTEERFDEFWWALHEREKIGDRAFCTNTYQKVYRNAVGEDSFDKSQRAAFNPLPPHTVFTESPKYLPA